MVHLHPTYSVAVSALADIDAANVLPPITAYYAMRVGRLPLVAYHPPDDLRLAEAVRRLAGKHHAVLLANHGPVVAGPRVKKTDCKGTPKSDFRYRSRIGRGQRSLVTISLNQWPRRRIHLFRDRLRAC